MLSFWLARQRILEAVTPLAAEVVRLDEADGRVLAEDLESNVDLPGFDYSAMDGYAVSSASFSGGGPWKFRVSIEQRAGSPASELPEGSVARIFTGAELPRGADAIVMQEEVTREGELACFSGTPAPGAHVRRRGDDLRLGALALARGTRLNPYCIGLAAALDRAQLRVARRPNVALLCTGDELREPGSAPRPGSIPDSNGPSLALLARRAGAQVTRVARVGDELEAVQRAIGDALRASDLLLTVGGVSVGDHDVVKSALEREGVALDFWKVKIKPGKPLAFGRAGGALVLGLPGNPVSAQITLGLFGLPLLRALQGDLRPWPSTLRARLARAIRQKPGRLGFYRARLEGDRAHVHENQASGAPTSMASADALVMVPEDCEELAAGSEVEALRLEDL